MDQYAENIINELTATNSWKELASFIYGYTLHSNDYDYVLELCCKFSQHEEEHVRGMAVLGFSHIWLVHRKIDTERVFPIIHARLKDASEFVRSKAYDANDDLLQYTKKHKRARGKAQKPR